MNTDMTDLKKLREFDASHKGKATYSSAVVIALLDRLEESEKDAARYRFMKEADIMMRYKLQFYADAALDEFIDNSLKDEQK